MPDVGSSEVVEESIEVVEDLDLSVVLLLVLSFDERAVEILWEEWFHEGRHLLFLGYYDETVSTGER